MLATAAPLRATHTAPLRATHTAPLRVADTAPLRAADAAPLRVADTAPHRADSEDGALARRYLDGDSDAAGILWQRFHAGLVSVCYEHTKDMAAAEDLAQETFVRVLAALDRFDLTSPMWPWVRTIALRLVIDHQRHNEFEVPTGLPQEIDEDDAEVHESMLVDDFAEGLIERSMLHLALKQIPVRQRVVIALRYRDQWSINETARFLGTNVGSCKQLLWRARTSLRESYEALGLEG